MPVIRYYCWFFVEVGYGEEEGEEITRDLWQEACWIVISSYFDEKGLVRQQLDSFDEFIQMSVQRIVEDSPEIDLQAESLHMTADTETPVSYKIITEFVKEAMSCREFAHWAHPVWHLQMSVGCLSCWSKSNQSKVKEFAAVPSEWCKEYIKQGCCKWLLRFFRLANPALN